jgi:equilibrative nucleoside transporter 1/2/3
MERLRQMFAREDSAASYEPLQGGSERPDGEHIDAEEQAFSWTDYAVFTLLGVAMLWAWYALTHSLSSIQLTSI